MSAIHQQGSFFQSLRSQRELDVTREISRQGNAATKAESGLEAIAHSLLRVPGITRVTLQFGVGTLKARSFDWPGRIWAGPYGTAISKVSANGRSLGDLRIEFGIAALEVSSPVRFAQYAGQQIAAMLLRLERLVQHEILSTRLLAQQEILASRKVIHRAAGILSRRLGLPEREAIEELHRRARVTRERPASVAESVIREESPRGGQ